VNIKSTGSGGFTLLETLVALIVLSFVVLGLSQGLRFGVDAWDHQSAIISRDGDLDAIDRLLRTMIAGMVAADDPHVVAIEGTRDRLAFTTAMPAGAPVGPHRLADVLLGVDGSRRLVIRWTPHLHARLLMPPAAHETTLLPGVAGLTLAYFQNAKAGQPAGWVTQWRGAIPPALVRLHLDFVAAEMRWPDLIVAPMRRPDEG
jgi:general secretion pathway protein J